MADFFTANNDMTAHELFEFRKSFREDAYSSALAPYLINVWNEKHGYGKVDQHRQSIFISESNLKPINSEDDIILVADFVADAFEDLRSYMQRAVAQRKIAKASMLAAMNPMKGWVSPASIHHEQVKYLYDLIVGQQFGSLSRDRKITSFKTFVDQFIRTWKLIAHHFAFTRSGFIQSRYCTPLISGLVIEIAEEDYSEDSVKQEKFIDSPNFNFYKNAARGFGFRIDKNAPWRLIAHISSRQMQEYMSQYGIVATPGNTGDLFDLYYYKAHEHDVNIMKSYLIQMYNSYVASHPYFKTPRFDAHGNSNGYKTIKRKPVTEENLDRLLPPKYWLKTYATIKFMEGKKNPEDKSIAKKIDKALTIQKTLDIQSAIRYIVREASD